MRTGWLGLYNWTLYKYTLHSPPPSRCTASEPACPSCWPQSAAEVKQRSEVKVRSSEHRDSERTRHGHGLPWWLNRVERVQIGHFLLAKWIMIACQGHGVCYPCTHTQFMEGIFTSWCYLAKSWQRIKTKQVTIVCLILQFIESNTQDDASSKT